MDADSCFGGQKQPATEIARHGLLLSPPAIRVKGVYFIQIVANCAHLHFSCSLLSFWSSGWLPWNPSGGTQTQRRWRHDYDIGRKGGIGSGNGAGLTAAQAAASLHWRQQ
jgi:hypothetical protein